MLITAELGGEGLEIEVEGDTVAEGGDWIETVGEQSRGGRTGTWIGGREAETIGVAAKGNWSSWKMTSREMYIRLESMWKHL
jgi:hypothetical protein